MMMTIDYEEKVLEQLKLGQVSFKDLLSLKEYIDIDTLQSIFDKYIGTIKEVH